MRMHSGLIASSSRILQEAKEVGLVTAREPAMEDCVEQSFRVWGAIPLPSFKGKSSFSRKTQAKLNKKIKIKDKTEKFVLSSFAHIICNLH